jgi:hypothetical protein
VCVCVYIYIHIYLSCCLTFNLLKITLKSYFVKIAMMWLECSKVNVGMFLHLK